MRTALSRVLRYGFCVLGILFVRLEGLAQKQLKMVVPGAPWTLMLPKAGFEMESARISPAGRKGSKGAGRGEKMAVSVKGAELFYSTRGNGPECLVLSGIGTKPYERQTPPQLSERLRLVYVDMRGSGRSTGEPADLTFDVLADDLEAIRADLGVERIAVLGHSILGILALEYGRRHPESVSHVIVVGTAPSGDVARVSAKATAFFEEDASGDRKRLLRDNLAKLPPDASLMQTVFAQTPLRFFDARFDAAPLFAEAERRPGLLMHVMGTLAPAWDITVGSSSLRMPIFIALGRYDYVVPYVLWEGLAAQLPSATLQVFEQSGHQPFFEEPDRFAADLTDWMNRQGF